jgi:hypothetical protein
MKIEVNLATVMSALLIAVLSWAGATLYNLDKKVALLEYQAQQTNTVLQMLSEDE